MRNKSVDESGNKYGMLTVIRFAGKKQKGTVLWECLCECGKNHVVAGCHLRSGDTKSCGCRPNKACKTHGLWHHPLYRSFHDARRRCTDPKCHNWQNYGARGIQFKLGTLQEFASIMKSLWFTGATLGRIDNNGHYEYGNIRWETMKQQSSNTRSNVFLSFGGRTMIISEWAREIGISTMGLRYRVRSWGVNRAISEPIKQRNVQL